MYDGLDPFPRQQRLDQLPIADVALHEARPARDGLGVPRAQVIEHEHAVVPLEKLVYDDAADVPCPAGHKYALGHAGGSIPNRRRSASSRP